MVRFRDVSIRRKLLLINVFTTGVALVLASTAFISYERVRFEQDVRRQLSTVADVIGANARPAVVGEDRAAGEAVLGGLRAEPRILAACLYGASGRVLACYARDAGADRIFPSTVAAEGIRSQDGDLLLARPIFAEGRAVGAMWLRFDSRISLETLRREIGLVSLTVAICFIIAVLVSSKLQRAISKPVRSLAQTAAEIAAGHDDSIRAEKFGEDELGRLVDAFNEMLSRLGERAGELRSIYDSAIDAIVTVASDGAITSWNRGAEAIFGFGESEVVGRPLTG